MIGVANFSFRLLVEKAHKAMKLSSSLEKIT